MSKHKLFFDGLAYQFNKGSWEGLVRMVTHELDKQRVKGEKRAEQRIIKLLEERVHWLLDQDTFMQIAEAESWLRAIALIKGENK